MLAKDKKKVDTLVREYSGDAGLLISVLQDVQNAFGYLREDILSYLAQKLKVSESKIWGIVTFYSQFRLKPGGKHTIKVCMGTACHVRGADKVLDRLQRILRIKVGETTEDMQFSLEIVRCLGTCFLAPVIMVNQEYFGRVNPDRVENMLSRYNKR